MFGLISHFLVTRPEVGCIVKGTSEFFISLSDHQDWDNAFSVFGEVTNRLHPPPKQKHINVLNERYLEIDIKVLLPFPRVKWKVSPFCEF